MVESASRGGRLLYGIPPVRRPSRSCVKKFSARILHEDGDSEQSRNWCRWKDLVDILFMIDRHEVFR